MMHDRTDPSHWDALYFDQAIPVDMVAKDYMIKDLRNWTRNYFLLPIKGFANLSLAVIMTVKRLLPFQFHHYGLMHRSSAFFLKHFVSPEACYLIVRHICIGSNIVNFLIDNGPDRGIPKSTLYPRTIDDLGKNAFLEHDLILYNFLLDYARGEAASPDWREMLGELDYSSIREVEVDVDFTRRGLRLLDLESAIELFKIFYALCLTSDEFERAVLSLEFDENIGCHVSRVMDDYRWNSVITNRNPLAPDSPFGASRRLLIHGVITEYLHRYLELMAVKS